MTIQRRGVLIALEGIDGSGKSTLQRHLARVLRKAGFDVVCIREPFNRALGQEALRITRTNPSWAAALFTLDRWAARPRVRALLARPAVVLSDRSFYSTLAYQGSALRPGRQAELAKLQRAVAEVPDRVVLLDLSPREGLRRVHRRGRRRTPPEELEFLGRVHRAYRRMSRRPGWSVLDARQPPAALADQVLRSLGPMVRRRLRPARRDD